MPGPSELCRLDEQKEDLLSAAYSIITDYQSLLRDTPYMDAPVYRRAEEFIYNYDEPLYVTGVEPCL